MFLHDQCQERQRGSTNSSRSHTTPPATTTPAHRMLTPGPSGRNSPAAAMASPERRRTLARITERVRRIAGANTKRRRELHGLLGWMASFMESRSLAWHPRNLEPYSSYKLGSTGVCSGFPTIRQRRAIGRSRLHHIAPAMSSRVQIGGPVPDARTFAYIYKRNPRRVRLVGASQLRVATRSGSQPNFISIRVSSKRKRPRTWSRDHYGADPLAGARV